MIKFYENGKAFLDDNLEILNKYPLDTSFFLVNSKSIHTFNRRNYCFKVINNSSYLLVMRLDDYNLILFGDKNLVKEAVNTILDYHLYFYGVLASVELVNEFFKHMIDRRGGEKVIRYNMDMMYLDKLLFNPTMTVNRAKEEDYTILVDFMTKFYKEALHKENPDVNSIRLDLKNNLISYYLLKINNKIVSMARISRMEDHIAAISAVYTPKEFRNNGYSAQVVSTICKDLLQLNKVPYLYVDKQNPISNHLYSKLGFKYGESKIDASYKQGNIKTLILAGGCFWCMAKPYYEYNGVIRVISGYTGGEELFPNYEKVKEHKTGHREAILIEYDKTINIDPFDNSGQFIDRGFNYSCAVFTDDDNVLDYTYIKRYNLEKEFNKKVYIDELREQVFFKAEEYHQDYALKNPKEMEEELISSGRKGV